ncbi:hypothetical protein D3C79_919740 [compost metagenome]
MNLEEYLQQVVKCELKWMYHYDIDDPSFGIATDKYTWCKGVLDGNRYVDQLLEYFTENYPNDEKHFIDVIRSMMEGGEVV